MLKYDADDVLYIVSIRSSSVGRLREHYLTTGGDRIRISYGVLSLKAKKQHIHMEGGLNVQMLISHS